MKEEEEEDDGGDQRRQRAALMELLRSGCWNREMHGLTQRAVEAHHSTSSPQTRTETHIVDA